jgi:hypothetical protein
MHGGFFKRAARCVVACPNCTAVFFCAFVSRIRYALHVGWPPVTFLASACWRPVGLGPKFTHSVTNKRPISHTLRATRRTAWRAECRKSPVVTFADRGLIKFLRARMTRLASR